MAVSLRAMFKLVPRVLVSSCSRFHRSVGGASPKAFISSFSLRSFPNRILLTSPFTRSIKAGLTPATIEERVLAICSGFEKVPSDKLTLDSKLADFGLDSLDHIEIVMEIENEFWLEIADVDAEKLSTPRDIVNHVWSMALKAQPIE
ncbi:hypothetical protein EG68_12104 [Paragonimus skrjabini miyazakii]|uniref:Acyl carrier protein n=1 Tax=Paragonimus skrjabini miyazakii TaxID=59628 RepID=A0A8S9YAP6_9TREM|nr:hypothetical protein EG68_12104 [Paragonimus skrjabini miyazakii]